MEAINKQNINLPYNGILNDTLVQNTSFSKYANNMDNQNQTIKVEDSIISSSVYYVDFDDEIKKHMNISVEQEQTNKDVINTLYNNSLLYSDDKDEPSLVSATAFESLYSLHAYSEKYGFDIPPRLTMSSILGGFSADFTQEEILNFIKKIDKMKEGLSINSIEAAKKYDEKYRQKPVDAFYLKTTAQMDKNGLHPIHVDNYEAFNQKDWEEHTKNWDIAEAFKNKYQFSEEFIKTEKFQELYKEYEEKLWKIKVQKHEAFMNGEISSEITPLERIEEDVLSKNFNKRETIEYFENKKDTLENLLGNGKDTLGEFYLKNGKRTVDYYENIIKNLKELWKFGDYDKYL
jgi:uncharacterized protein YjgD (DUF1641 family)